VFDRVLEDVVRLDYQTKTKLKLLRNTCMFMYYYNLQTMLTEEMKLQKEVDVARLLIYFLTYLTTL
jgi:hypothetical protein